mmetsp:Transcript_38100/g.113834  ORF Transcript_38100/g.113834 Transcript_38100/m.113834 type:complete len:387 (+) Transcript_38100:515-1675(+)
MPRRPQPPPFVLGRRKGKVGPALAVHAHLPRHVHLLRDAIDGRSREFQKERGTDRHRIRSSSAAAPATARVRVERLDGRRIEELAPFHVDAERAESRRGPGRVVQGSKAAHGRRHVLRYGMQPRGDAGDHAQRPLRTAHQRGQVVPRARFDRVGARDGDGPVGEDDLQSQYVLSHRAVFDRGGSRRSARDHAAEGGVGARIDHERHAGVTEGFVERPAGDPGADVNVRVGEESAVVRRRRAVVRKLDGIETGHVEGDGSPAYRRYVSLEAGSGAPRYDRHGGLGASTHDRRYLRRRFGEEDGRGRGEGMPRFAPPVSLEVVSVGGGDEAGDVIFEGRQKVGGETAETAATLLLGGGDRRRRRRRRRLLSERAAAAAAAAAGGGGGK